MATIILTIPDAILQRVIDGLCGAYHYSTTLTGGAPNPETKAQFAKRMIADTAKDAIRKYEGQVADDAAKILATAQIDIT